MEINEKMKERKEGKKLESNGKQGGHTRENYYRRLLGEKIQYRTSIKDPYRTVPVIKNYYGSHLWKSDWVCAPSSPALASPFSFTSSRFLAASTASIPAIRRSLTTEPSSITCDTLFLMNYQNVSITS